MIVLWEATNPSRGRRSIEIIPGQASTSSLLGIALSSGLESERPYPGPRATRPRFAILYFYTSNKIPLTRIYTVVNV